MAKYRKRPLVIEAIQFDGHWTPIARWMESLSETGFAFPMGEGPPVVKSNSQDGLEVNTPEGWVKCSIGSWLCRGVRGEFYPCKPDIFDESYELVVD